ncbi:SulP family inorganic anion transporter [Knoellia aerolata]|uniref:Sulfate transporter n=1 Tax=Knoellia aerolata DSM 18566 TaxID=1385519 RepID=A0A0A0JVF6_9MICO|nr:sulfate permease [Knoellia aerolata]KGN40689.1 sulfate transporter [Knoellia aerolata DSM 18566]
MAGRDGRRAGSTAPGLATLRSYDRTWLRGDVLAGVTVAAYLVPQVMAYAGVAGLPAVVGLWAACVSMVLYTLLGSSRQLSVGPESTTALMTAVALGSVAAGSPERHAALAAALAGMVGVICLIAWALRLGFLAELLSRPVLAGYMAGVAALMVVSQLDTVTGLEVTGDTAAEEVGSVLRQLGDVHGPTVVLAAIVLALLLLTNRLWPRAPGPLLAVVLSAGAVAVLDLGSRGIDVVGPVPRGLPSLSVPELSLADVRTLLPAALGIAVVAFTDNVLTGRAFGERHDSTLDAKQELLALGTVNLAVAATQGFPVSSSGSRTAIVDSAGGRTQLNALVALASVVVAVLVLNPVLAAFPSAALGALVVYAGIRLVDVPLFRRIFAFRRTEGALAVGTTAAVLVVGILPGVLVAIVLSLLDLLHRVTRPHDGILGHVPGVAGMHDIDDYPTATTVPGLVVYRYDSPLFFANADDFVTRAIDAVDRAPTPARWLLLNMEANVTVDITAADALEMLRVELERRGVVLALARVKQDLREELERTGLVARVGRERVFMTLPFAVDGYAAWSAAHPEPPAGAGSPR